MSFYAITLVHSEQLTRHTIIRAALTNGHIFAFQGVEEKRYERRVFYWTKSVPHVILTQSETKGKDLNKERISMFIEILRLRLRMTGVKLKNVSISKSAAENDKGSIGFASG